MVYGLRAQSPKYDWDQGSEQRAQGSEEWDQVKKHLARNLNLMSMMSSTTYSNGPSADWRRIRKTDVEVRWFVWVICNRCGNLLARWEKREVTKIHCTIYNISSSPRRADTWFPSITLKSVRTDGVRWRHHQIFSDGFSYPRCSAGAPFARERAPLLITPSRRRVFFRMGGSKQIFNIKAN